LGASPIASLLCRGAGAAVACREAAAAATSGAPRPVKSVSPRPAPVAQWIEQRFPKPCAKVRFLPGVPAGRRGGPPCRGPEAGAGSATGSAPAPGVLRAFCLSPAGLGGRRLVSSEVGEQAPIPRKHGTAAAAACVGAITGRIGSWIGHRTTHDQQPLADGVVGAIPRAWRRLSGPHRHGPSSWRWSRRYPTLWRVAIRTGT
jgi:hypothetical protein